MRLLQKLTSRKFWLAIAGVATGVAVALGASGAEIQSVSTAVQTLIGCVTALMAAVAYIRTEGTIDAAAAGKTASSVQAAVEAAQAIADTVNGDFTDDAEVNHENAG